MTKVGVTYVDTSGDTAGREGDYLKGGKIRLSENVDFKFWTPRKVFDQLWGTVNQLLILGAHLLVDDRDETCATVIISTPNVCESTLAFPLGAATVRIYIAFFRGGQAVFDRRTYLDARLNEAYITLDRGPNILHPFDGSLLVGRNGAGSKSIAFLVRESPLGRGGTYDTMYSSIILDWWSLAVYFLALRSLGKSEPSVGEKCRTSVKASIDLFRASRKSPYWMDKLIFLSSTSISCSALADG